jgi:uncharacterized membrane protein (TIGR02234 family)
VAALLLGAAALWGSSRLPWIQVPRGLTVNGRLSPDITGSDVVSGLTPLALLTLAAVAAVVASGGWVRRLLGLLLLVVGLWIGYVAIAGALQGVHWTGWAPGYGPGAGSPERTVWGPLTAVGGALLVACAGGTLLWRGHRMSRMGAKYTAPGSGRGRRDPDAEIWDALSEGEDPTTRG